MVSPSGCAQEHDLVLVESVERHRLLHRLQERLRVFEGQEENHAPCAYDRLLRQLFHDLTREGGEYCVI